MVDSSLESYQLMTYLIGLEDECFSLWKEKKLKQEEINPFYYLTGILFIKETDHLFRGARIKPSVYENSDNNAIIS